MKQYIDLEEFEKIMEYDAAKKKFNILLFNKNNKDSTCFSRLSIFDNEERGRIKEDKKKVQDLLKALMGDSLIEKEENLKKFTDLEKKAMGSMLGMAIGDAMGSRLEFYPYISEDKLKPSELLLNMGDKPGGKFRLEPGQWTDDSSMGLCLADSLLVKKGQLDKFDLMNRFIAWWTGGYNNAFRNNHKYGLPTRHSVGLGGNISLSFRQYMHHPVEETNAGNENTSGNGSIMRNAAIPICYYYDIKLACQKAKEQSLTTHQGIQAKECCNILTYIIVKILNEEKNTENNEEKNAEKNKPKNAEKNKQKEKLKYILDNLKVEKILDQKEIKKYPSIYKSIQCLINSEKEKEKEKDKEYKENWDWRNNEIYKYNQKRAEKQPGYIGSYAMDNLVMSLNIVYRTDNFKDAIIKAVNLGGDADSVASVVGQIAGAAYSLESIPSDWIKAIYKWDDGEIALRGYMLSKLHLKPNYYYEKEEEKENEKNKNKK